MYIDLLFSNRFQDNSTSTQILRNNILACLNCKEIFLDLFKNVSIFFYMLGVIHIILI